MPGPRRLKQLSFLRLFVLLFVWLGFSGAGMAFHIYAYFAAQLPSDLHALRDDPTMATRVYSADGELIGEFFLQKRVPVPLEAIPEHVRQAYLSAEDGRFWDHPGFDIWGIIRAARTNFLSNAPSQGASTITQQVTRMILLSTEKTIDRKVKELILSVRVERELSKREILEMYLNRVYLGHGAYGVQAAAEIFFGKDVDDLTIGEAAMLAGLPQRPTDYSPLKNLPAARWRQKYVLERMVADGYISTAQKDEALRQPIALVEDEVPLNHVAAPFFVEHVRRWAQKRFGQETVFDGGLRIYTTLDMTMQRSAEAAVHDGLDNLDRMIGFRKPIGHVDDAQLATFRGAPPTPYVVGLGAATGAGDDLLPDVSYVGAVVEMPPKGGVVVAVGRHTLPMKEADGKHLRNWRQKAESGPPGDTPSRRGPRPVLQLGDLIPVRPIESATGTTELALAQLPDVEGSLLAMDQHTGQIQAMVGGYDYRTTQFNRVTQAKRQIGSAIKPFIYATAMMHGVSALDIFSDSPIAVATAGGIWSPSNYDGTYKGPVTLRTAIAHSLNTVAVRLLLGVGVESVIETMRAVGIQSDIPHHISIALGTPDLTLLEAVSGYAAFANGGKRIEGQDGRPGEPPGRFVELVTKPDGTILADYRRRTPHRQVIDRDLAYLVVDLLRAPVERGTAKRAQELGRPAAGKTGTSTNFRDAWFIGFTNDRLVGVWVGRDDFTPIGIKATGGTTALPIWLQFMTAAHPETPATEFPIPPGVTLVRANEMTGQPVAAGTPGARWIPFARGTVPARFAAGAGSSGFAGSEELAPGDATADKRAANQPAKP